MAGILHRSFTFIGSFSIALLATRGTARATDFELSTAAEPVPTSQSFGRFDPFARGTWSLDVVGLYTHPLNGPQAFAGGAVGFSFAARDGVVVGIDLQGDAMLDPDEADGFTGGADLKARLRLGEWHEVSFFFDATVGPILNGVSVPRDSGGHFSFRETLGVGAYVPISDDVLLLTGVRFEHISNGGTQSPNPGYNGVQFYIGVTIPL